MAPGGCPICFVASEGLWLLWSPASRGEFPFPACFPAGKGQKGPKSRPPPRYRAGLGQLHPDVDELVLERFLLVQQLLRVGRLAPEHLQLLVRPHQGALQALLREQMEPPGPGCSITHRERHGLSPSSEMSPNCCHIPGSVQSQVGWAWSNLGLENGIPAHQEGLKLDDL